MISVTVSWQIGMRRMRRIFDILFKNNSSTNNNGNLSVNWYEYLTSELKECWRNCNCCGKYWTNLSSFGQSEVVGNEELVLAMPNPARMLKV